MTLFHRHKWGAEIVNGYQRCEKCGKAEPIPCKHQWKCVDGIRHDWGFLDSVDILECTKCGDRKEVRYSVL